MNAATVLNGRSQQKTILGTESILEFIVAFPCNYC